MLSRAAIPADDLLRGHDHHVLRRATLDALMAHDRDAAIGRIRSLGPDIATSWRAFAGENRVTPVVAHALMEAFGDDFPQAARWKADHDQSLRRMTIMMAALDRVADALHNAGIRMVALKNAGIARGIYPCAGCCPMGDLDVVIERARFRQAHEIICGQGFELATRGTVEAADLEEGLESGGTEYVATIGGEEVWFELQWRPVAGRWIRRDQEPDGAQMIARSVPIEGTRVRLLAPVDNMIQVALHTAKHTYVRAPGLRLHTDVDRLARYQTPDWAKVCDMALALDVKTATFFSFALARALLDTPVPDSVLERLKPAEWKRRSIVRWLNRVDVFMPNERKFSRPAMIGFTALMYDDASGLLASVLDTDKEHLGLRDLPHNLSRGVRRVKDLLFRYER